MKSTLPALACAVFLASGYAAPQEPAKTPASEAPAAESKPDQKAGSESEEQAAQRKTEERRRAVLEEERRRGRVEASASGDSGKPNPTPIVIGDPPKPHKAVAK